MPELIAGQVSLDDVMARLSQDRPVFHSEADLQHAFAQVLWQLAPDVRSRLEVRQRGAARKALDLLCIGPSARTAIEFKYFTRQWIGTAGSHQEEYDLRSHAADDLARLHFVTDITRLEGFCSKPDENGLALIVTNAKGLWLPPRGPRETNYREFRIHDGQKLTGTRRWANGYEPNTRTLRGTYGLGWHSYSQLPGSNGEFRYLAIFIEPPT